MNYHDNIKTKKMHLKLKKIFFFATELRTLKYSVFIF